MQFDVPEPQELPYFDHGDSLSESIRNSSRRRNMSPLHFAFRKLKNVILYRLTFFCPFNSLRIKMHRWRGVHIGKNVYIAMQCSIDNAYPEYVYIEDDASFATEVTIIAHMNPYGNFEGIIEPVVKPVVVQRGAWICTRALLLPGANVGRYAIVSAASVVDGEVKAGTIVAGNPAKEKIDFSRLKKKEIEAE